MIRSKLSPSFVIASLALCLSMTGGAIAASHLITGAQIKNGTIQLKDLSARAQAALRGQTGPTGAAGPQGPAGPVGPQGAPQSPQTFYTYVGAADAPEASVDISPGDIGTAKATCHGFDRLVGGGYRSGPDASVYESTRVVASAGLASDDPSAPPDQSAGESWQVKARNDGASTVTLTAIAYCASS
jgi:hypothetical protein